MWPRPPKFLMVDDYNVGNGSVFEVAAQQNNVTYTRSCCGLVPSLAGRVIPFGAVLGLSAFVLFAMVVLS